MVYYSGYDYGMATVGGILISLSTSFNLLFKGRVTGMSGIFYGVITFNDILWRISLILGMIWTSSLFRFSVGKDSYFYDSGEKNLENCSLAGFAVAGFLVGLGTKMGNGCTSGHGVCGLPRLSKRSIVAVLVFCSFGIGTATLRYYKHFFYETEIIQLADDINSQLFHMIFFICISGLLFGLFIFLLVKKRWEEIREFLISFITGILFSLGLVISGMNRRRKVIGFLTAYEGWDPSLMFVLVSAVTLNFILFRVIMKYKKNPIFATKYGFSSNTVIDWRLILGSALFGIGWGISGLCPGPLFVTFFVYIPHLIIFLVTLAVGQFSLLLIDKIIEKCQKNHDEDPSKIV
jgi:uncharacterized protein